MAAGISSMKHFKVLIPCETADLMTANNEKLRKNIEDYTGAQIKISQGLFPETNEKVLLISSFMQKNVVHANFFVMVAVSTCSGAYCTNFFDRLLQVNIMRENQVKILIPNTCAGRIIGSKGRNIEKIKEYSGAFVFLPQEPYASMLQERCISVAGDIIQNDIACQLLFEIFANFSDVDYYSNIEYTDEDPLPIIYPYGPLFLISRPPPVSSPSALEASWNAGQLQSQLDSAGQQRQNQLEVDALTLPRIIFNNVLVKMRQQLSEKGNSDAFISEATGALTFLYEKKILDLRVVLRKPTGIDVPPENPGFQSKKTGGRRKKGKKLKTE